MTEGFTWFPARQISVDPATLRYAGTSPVKREDSGTNPEVGIKRRHHLLGKVYNKAIQRAAAAVGIVA